MLTELHIRDFAIIDELRLEFGPGLTVMTGETGAGKSILVDALGLAAGERGEAGMIRHGAERAEVAATFAVGASPSALAWLEQQAIEHDGECVIRRVVTRAGRSTAFINGSRVSAGALREFLASLLNIHGQQANQALLQRSTQRAVLDELAGHDARRVAVREAFAGWSAARRERDAVAARAGEAGHDDLAVLEHHVNELEALGLREGEVESLEAELRLLGSAGEVLEAAQRALALLSEEETGADTLLGRAARELAGAGEVDPRLAEVAATLEHALTAVGETAGALERYLSDVDLDPERLAAVERRLASVDEIARKHRVRPREVPAVFDRLAEQLAKRLSAADDLEAADRAVADAEARYRHEAAALHASRTAAAADVAATAIDIIRSLGLPNAQFAVDVVHDPDGTPAAHGLDEVTFLVSTNPGQPLAPLDRVASGGELSRISLALEVVAAEASTVPCLVFDEVDTGIGGGVAEIVGRSLRRLGESRQVLCVTHLPQVASQAHSHVGVRKEVQEGTTRTALHWLQGEEVVNELARMLGGVRITERTLAHAREMRERAGEEV